MWTGRSLKQYGDLEHGIIDCFMYAQQVNHQWNHTLRKVFTQLQQLAWFNLFLQLLSVMHNYVYTLSHSHMHHSAVQNNIYKCLSSRLLINFWYSDMRQILHRRVWEKWKCGHTVGSISAICANSFGGECVEDVTPNHHIFWSAGIARVDGSKRQSACIQSGLKLWMAWWWSKVRNNASPADVRSKEGRKKGGWGKASASTCSTYVHIWIVVRQFPAEDFRRLW